jgi:hypothetical protein
MRCVNSESVTGFSAQAANGVSGTGVVPAELAPPPQPATFAKHTKAPEQRRMNEIIFIAIFPFNQCDAWLFYIKTIP